MKKSIKTTHIFIGVLSFFAVIAMLSYIIIEEKADAGYVSYSGDALITQAIRSKFTVVKDTSLTSINVRTSDGAVLLSGFSRSEEEKSAAESVAHQVSGVKSVKNEVTVRR